MVTLMLIPTIFFTGFMTDLARIKLSSNQAVMAADNYGEAILTEYDYLLKELYGLFAISQNEEGKAAIEDLQKYMTTSFDPASNTITWDHLAGWTGFLAGDYEGCMPYKSADIKMEYKPVENSKLSSQEILSTQVGDFMRFRIVQLFMDEGIQDELLEALMQGQQAEEDSAALDVKTDFDDAVAKLMEAMKAYYDVLKEINHYPEYIVNINDAYDDAKKKFSDIANSDSYRIYRDYIDNKDAIEAARSVAEDERTEEDEKYVEMGYAYDGDSSARYGELWDKFEAVVDEYDNCKDDDIIDFDSFDSHADDLKEKASDVESKMETAKIQRDRLEAALNAGVTEELKSGIQDSIKIFDDMVNSEYASACYINLANKVSSNENKTVNSDFELAMINQSYQLEQVASDYLADPAVDISEYKDKLDKDNYDDFQDYATYKKLYEKLEKMFDNKNSDQEEKAKQQKKDAEDAKNKAEEELNNEEETEARSIPESIAIGDGEEGSGFAIVNLIKSAASYFKMNSFAEAGNRLMLKFYMSAYDYGMFSNRVTNVEKESENEGEGSEGEDSEAVSLTGIKMCRSVNYLYQAEMEYLYGGHKDSGKNLNDAKNCILAFRAVVNMTSTYTIKEINNPIKAIRDSLIELPVLAIAVEAALRLGITALETAADWNQLKKGESVILVKRKIGDLQAIDAISSFIDLGSGGEKSEGVELNYSQYLLVMVTFLRTSDQIAKRTGDLITLNVNAVQQEVGENGELSELKFKLDNAYTAAEASCTAYIKFVVMPDGFAKKTLNSSTYDSLAEYENNKYKYTVIRGY